MGIKTDDFGTALRQLAQSGNKGQKAIIAVGQEAGPALKALLAQGMPALDTLIGKLKRAGGSAKEMADIMSDNLDGSITGLGSAWLTLKDTLGAPIIEPLTAKVKKLTTILRNFVATGRVEQMGQAVADAFTKMADKALLFIEGFILSGVTDSVTEFTANFTENFNTVKNTFSLVYNVLATGMNTLKSIVYGWDSAYTKVLSYISLAVTKVLEFTPRMEEAAKSMQEQVEALTEVSDEFGKRASQAFEDAVDSSKNLRDNISNLSDATNAHSAASEKNAMAVNAEAEAFNKKSARLRKLKKLEIESIKGGLDNTQQYNDVLKERINLEVEIAAKTEGKVLLEQQVSDSLETTEQKMQAVIDTEAQLAKAREQAIASSSEALKSLGVDVNQVTTGVGTTAQKMMETFSEAMQGAKASGTENMAVTRAAIQKVLDSLNSKEEFEAFKQQLKTTGNIGKATADQLSQMSAGIKGASEAAASSSSKQSNAAKQSTKSVKDNTEASKENSEAVKENAQETDKASESTGAYAFSFEKSVKGLKAYNETFNNINWIGNYGFIAAQTKAVEAAVAAQEAEAEALRVTGEASANLNEKMKDGTLTMADVESASAAAGFAIEALNEADLKDLNNSIDSAKQKLQSLEDKARSVAQSVADRLADATGDADDKINRKFEREIENIREQQTEANGVGNGDYERAIADLEKLKQVELEKQQERKRADAKREAERASKTSTSRGQGVNLDDVKTVIQRDYGNDNSMKEELHNFAKHMAEELDKASDDGAKKAVKEIRDGLRQYRNGQGR